MQEDSMQLSNSGQMIHNPPVLQESPSKCLKCSLCRYYFKSKVYLFEHLNKEHFLDVDAALKAAGLKQHGPNDANNTDGNNSGDSFKCQQCDFKACHQDVLNEHEKECQKNVSISESPKSSETSTNQQEETEVVEKLSPVISIISTSKSKCTLNSSKDIKTYKRPLQTITKYFAVSSGSNVKSPEKSPDSSMSPESTKGTLILQESPSNSNPNSSGVFKVTAKPTIDILYNDSTRCLLDDHLQSPDLRPPKPKEKTDPDNVDKRSSNERSAGPPAKKAKSDKRVTSLPEKVNPSKQQLSNGTEFSFEFSEDEEDKLFNLVNGDRENPDVYFCKHCDYSDVGIRRLSTHYQNDHPYIRYSAVYIQNPSDQSATFRCLECPVDFLSVAELKRHYAENHPEAPNIFTMQLHELNLVYKCFECLFTTNAAKALNKHYKEEHPMHQVDNSLMYCKYSSRKYQDGLSPLNTTEKITRPGAISPQNDNKPCGDFKNTADHPTSEGADVALYHCRKCNFSHKSVVVLHVHYQKSHPDEAVSIDKIKQSAQSKIVLQTNKSLSTVITIRKSTPPKDISNSSKYTSICPPLTKEKTTLSLKNPKHMPEASQTISNKVESTEEGSNGKNSPTKQESEMSTSGMETAPCSLPNRYYYCLHCSYSSINLNSVAAHHKAKHPIHPLSMSKLLQYSHEMQKKELGNEVEVSARSVPISCKPVKECSDREPGQEGDNAEDASCRRFNPYVCAENLFYCLMCNMGNPTVTGVMNHQRKVHRNGCSRDEIIEYSVSIQNEIEKSKSQAKELSFSTHLPLPIMNEGDECKFFCHFCNYRHSLMEQVTRHYLKRHNGFVIKSEDIRQYTDLVCRQPQKLAPQTNANRVNAKDRVLQCHRCPYNTQYVYLLKRHLWKIHKANRSVTDVLRLCFNQGTLETGYHCDLCVFSDKSASAVHEHYQKQHPKRRLGRDYINTRLYVGPETLPPKKKRPPILHTDGISDTAGSLPSQRSGLIESKTYSCKACSFKGGSVSSITAHYRAVHPWSVKEDGSVLDVINIKRPGANRQAEDHSETPGAFDTNQVATEVEDLPDSSQETPESYDKYQVPLELDNAPGSSCDATVSPTTLKCSFCPAVFDTKRGLNTHCGLKHRDAMLKKLGEEHVQTKTRVHLFKCPHCPYVNTSYHGVLTHCQMRHPALLSYAESLQMAEADLQNWGHCVKRRGADLKICGYMCKTCPLMCETREKLNKHREKHRNGMLLNTVGLTLGPKLSALSKKIPKTHCNQGSVSKVSFLTRNKYAVVKCQQCSYQCTTKIALGRHLLVCKKKSSQDCLYECTLCSNTYYTKKRLGNHYLAKHGEENFLKHCTPIYKQEDQKPEEIPLDSSLTQQQENASQEGESGTVTKENKILFYKCPGCTYLNASHHGTLTHCQMQHPDIIARADELQTEEILESNMVGCSVGKNANERGFMCTKCPQIHVSLKKLKIHCERDHNETKARPSEPSVENEAGRQPPPLSITENDQAGTSGICKSNRFSIQKNEPMYKCNMCNYVGGCRKYLQGHYKKTHKLDAFTTYKLLEMYNKPHFTYIESPPSNSCTMCPNLPFDSPQLLLEHYRSSHNSDSILDFTILSVGSKKTTGLYSCTHCKKQMNGIRKLSYHLDRHRHVEMNKSKTAEKNASVVISTTESTLTELCEEDQLPLVETVDEQAQCNVTPVETPPSPSCPNTAPAPSKPTSPEPTNVAPREVKHTCNQCGRTFMSRKGLVTHKRSHAALAALKKLNHLSTSALNQNINDYVRFKPGTLRPFLCSFCPFRTTVMGLWKRHFLKKHPGVLMNPVKSDNQDEESTQREDREPYTSSEELSSLPELDEEPEIAHEPLYLEPPDVQRQLNHYNLMAQANAPSIVNVKENRSPEGHLLHCDLCNFNSGYLSSLRRHYMNRHGKKIITCKDCSFITGSRKTLEMHIKTGHLVSQSGPTPQKDFRCPFCLYQTKNKNTMIDHIVLHRDERVVPIEVRRPKLSRYLQGIVFRCHKCTFTSGSAENLRLHMIRHNDDVKPYKCQLCFFDCTQLSDLEAHLSDKHQVLRNHELVGQVNLDQLEVRDVRMTEEEEKPLFNLEGQHRTDRHVKTEEMVSACDEVPRETQVVKKLAEDDTRERNVLQVEEANWKQGEDCGNESEENPARSSGPDHQVENIVTNTAPKEKHEQEDACRLEKCMQIDENQAQPKPSEDSSTMSVQQKDVEEKSSTTYCSQAEKAEAHTMDDKELQYGTSETADMIHDDKLPQNSQLDEACDRKMDTNADQDITVESKQKAIMDEEGSIDLNTQGHSESVSTLEKKDCTEENDIKSQENSKVDLLSPNCARLNIVEEQVHNQSTNSEELSDSYGEMPVLENEYLKGDSRPGGCGNEEDDNDQVEQEGDEEEDKMMTEDKNQCQEIDGGKEAADDPQALRGARTEITEAAEILCPAVTEEKLFTCELCGRNLVNSSELKQHVMRHKI